MSTVKFIVPFYHDGEFSGHHVVDAEGIAGLHVHRNPTAHPFGNLSVWCISNAHGIRVTRVRLNTRDDARKMARILSPLLPDEIKSGEWRGDDWKQHDPESATRYQRDYWL